jgi:hypothetical protein
MSSDESSDEYHEDSLPDLVLSSAAGGDEPPYSPQYLSSSFLAYSAPDLLDTSCCDELTDIEAEYFSSGDQARTIFYFVFVSLLLSQRSKFIRIRDNFTIIVNQETFGNNFALGLYIVSCWVTLPSLPNTQRR